MTERVWENATVDDNGNIVMQGKLTINRSDGTTIFTVDPVNGISAGTEPIVQNDGVIPVTANSIVVFSGTGGAKIKSVPIVVGTDGSFKAGSNINPTPGTGVTGVEFRLLSPSWTTELNNSNSGYSIYTAVSHFTDPDYTMFMGYNVGPNYDPAKPSLLFEMESNGGANIAEAHFDFNTTVRTMSAATLVFTAASRTIKRNTGSWATDGLSIVGTTINVSGTVSNDGEYTVLSVSQTTNPNDTLTLAVGTTLVDETKAGATVTGYVLRRTFDTSMDNGTADCLTFFKGHTKVQDSAGLYDNFEVADGDYNTGNITARKSFIATKNVEIDGSLSVNKGSAPAHNLDVVGDALITGTSGTYGLTITRDEGGGDTSGVQFTRVAYGGGGMFILQPTGTLGKGVQFGGSTFGNIIADYANAGGPLYLRSGANNRIEIGATGIGFFGHAQAAQPTGVAATSADIIAALQSIGIFG